MVQLLLQYPQSLLVFNIVANWPVIGHLHIPNWHIEPKLHLLPHDPQLLLSVKWLIQYDPLPCKLLTSHVNWVPIEHVELHIPNEQLYTPKHFNPHEPQLLLSVL